MPHHPSEISNPIATSTYLDDLLQSSDKFFESIKTSAHLIKLLNQCSLEEVSLILKLINRFPGAWNKFIPCCGYFDFFYYSRAHLEGEQKIRLFIDNLIQYDHVWQQIVDTYIFMTLLERETDAVKKTLTGKVLGTETVWKKIITDTTTFLNIFDEVDDIKKHVMIEKLLEESEWKRLIKKEEMSFFASLLGICTGDTKLLLEKKLVTEKEWLSHYKKSNFFKRVAIKELISNLSENYREELLKQILSEEDHWHQDLIATNFAHLFTSASTEVQSQMLNQLTDKPKGLLSIMLRGGWSEAYFSVYDIVPPQVKSFMRDRFHEHRCFESTGEFRSVFQWVGLLGKSLMIEQLLRNETLSKKLLDKPHDFLHDIYLGTEKSKKLMLLSRIIVQEGPSCSFLGDWTLDIFKFYFVANELSFHFFRTHLGLCFTDETKTMLEAASSAEDVKAIIDQAIETNEIAELIQVGKTLGMLSQEKDCGLSFLETSNGELLSKIGSFSVYNSGYLPESTRTNIVANHLNTSSDVEGGAAPTR